MLYAQYIFEVNLCDHCLSLVIYKIVLASLSNINWDRFVFSFIAVHIIIAVKRLVLSCKYIRSWLAESNTNIVNFALNGAWCRYNLNNSWLLWRTDEFVWIIFSMSSSCHNYSFQLCFEDALTGYNDCFLQLLAKQIHRDYLVY